MVWLKPKQATEHFGVHINTLRNWDKLGKILTQRTPSGHRLYWDSFDLFPNNGIRIEDKQEFKEEEVIYCRVSTSRQKDDLKRQIEFMQLRHPNCRVIKDIASGINFKRKGLTALLE
jgi:predicted site-specific integrase-resolvase